MGKNTATNTAKIVDREDVDLGQCTGSLKTLLVDADPHGLPQLIKNLRRKCRAVRSDIDRRVDLSPGVCAVFASRRPVLAQYFSSFLPDSPTSRGKEKLQSLIGERETMRDRLPFYARFRIYLYLGCGLLVALVSLVTLLIANPTLRPTQIALAARHGTPRGACR